MVFAAVANYDSRLNLRKGCKGNPSIPLYEYSAGIVIIASDASQVEINVSLARGDAWRRVIVRFLAKIRVDPCPSSLL